MWFKNLQLYRLQQPFDLTPEALDEQLRTHLARECGSLEMASFGWYPPLGRHAELLTHAAGGCIMVCARREERVLPAAVVREQLAERVDAIEQAEMRKVRRREQADLRDELIHDLLPRAFTKASLTYAYIDRVNRWLVVDAASAKGAEDLITLLRETLGTLPLKPLQVTQSPSAVMTGWLKGQGPGEEFQLQDECELRDPVEEGAVVRCRRQDLGGTEIEAHLEAGKQAVRLALEWHERIGFVLGDDLSVKRLKFLDLVQEEAAETEAEDAATRFDVDFAIMSLELGRFLERLVKAFGGEADSD